MATPPITETIENLDVPRHRRWASRRALTRVAWLTADVVAFGACLALLVGGLT